jgi:hypothetical protein
VPEPRHQRRGCYSRRPKAGKFPAESKDKMNARNKGQKAVTPERAKWWFKRILKRLEKMGASNNQSNFMLDNNKQSK